MEFGHSAILWVGVGVATYVSIAQLLAWLRQPTDRSHGLLGLIALLTAYGCAAAAIAATRQENVVVCLASMLLPWLVRDYVSDPKRWPAAAIDAWYAAALVATIVSSEKPPHWSPSILSLADLAAFVYLVVSMVGALRHHRRAWQCAASFGPIAAMLLWQASGNFDLVAQVAHLGSLSFLPLLVIMSLLAAETDALREANGALERRIAQHTTEVANLNRELEAFVYSVSHDLRAPLMSINGFAELLIREQANKLDSTAQRYLTRIRDGALRIGQLIQDLLGLSRLTQQPMERRDVDLIPLVNTALEPLRASDPARHVAVTLPPTLPANGDAQLLSLALTHLLSNAWKYTSKTDDAAIEVGSFRSAHETVYFVKDNGAGFASDQADRLFRPYVRLHAESEFPGNGIGLATVARVVARHGGRVWAEGRPEAGATFYFTLPPPDRSPKNNIRG